jgi:fructose-bisphosphate aldolase class I
VTAIDLVATAAALFAGDKGLLAMDESNPTCNRRFAAVGIAQTEGARRAYREMIVTTPGLGECISGAILYDETIRQHMGDGTPFAQALVDAGIVPGIKVDLGETDLAGYPGEHVTEGLDGLRDRLAEYDQMGARGALSSTLVKVLPARRASTSTPARWHATRRCARKPAWSPWSSPKCSWPASTPWRAAPK